jgi:hypothetical protein
LQDKVSLNKEPNLFFEFANTILNVSYQKILFQLISNDKPSVETMNTLDHEGYTPFLRFV